MINLILYSDESTDRVVNRTRDYFANEMDIRAYDNIIWLKDMYVKFDNRMISVNIFNTNSDWKCKLNEYIKRVFNDENVYVTSSNNISRYFEVFTDSSSIECVYC